MQKLMFLTGEVFTSKQFWGSHFFGMSSAIWDFFERKERYGPVGLNFSTLNDPEDI